MRNRTKIICTIGPASSNLQCLEQLAENGMDIARLNFSHGTHEDHYKVINHIRTTPALKHVLIGMDTKGPELRVFLHSDLKVIKGHLLEIVTKKLYEEQNENRIGVNNIKRFIGFNKNDALWIDDGKLELTVEEVREDSLLMIAKNSHLVESGKKLTTSTGISDSAWLNDDDVSDVKFALQQNVSMLFISFVESPKHVELIRSICGSASVQLIAKIETVKGLERVEEIAAVSDGIMIARGDLGTNAGLSKLFSAQARILELAKKFSVIMATEVMLSMTTSETPTRAEISDVGNAVLNGCSAVMLSSETSVGKYPVQCVKMVREVIADAEEYLDKVNMSTN